MMHVSASGLGRDSRVVLASVFLIALKAVVAGFVQGSSAFMVVEERRSFSRRRMSAQ